MAAQMPIAGAKINQTASARLICRSFELRHVGQRGALTGVVWGYWLALLLEQLIKVTIYIDEALLEPRRQQCEGPRTLLLSVGEIQVLQIGDIHRILHCGVAAGKNLVRETKASRYLMLIFFVDAALRELREASDLWMEQSSPRLVIELLSQRREAALDRVNS
jgi:hypothetical protein